MEDKDLKISKTNKFIIGVFIVLVILSFGFGILKNKDHQYKLTTEEMLAIIDNYAENTIDPEIFIDILYSEDTLYQFIDLRTPREFAYGHLPYAINIPLEDILEVKFEPILNQEKRINILYYNDHAGACSPWMILTQLGYKNNKLLLGGYSYVKNYIIDDFSPMTGNYKDEKPQFNYVQEIEKASGGAPVKNSVQETVPSVPIKKKETESKGGC